MSRLAKLVFQRVIVVAFFILLQLAVLLATVLWLSEYRRWIQVVSTVLSILTIVYLLYDRTNSSYKIAWIILILAFPVAGICLYFTFGGRRLNLRTRQGMHQAEDMVRENLWQENLISDNLKNLSDPAAASAAYLYNVSGYPVYDNTETEYFPLGDLLYPKMLEELQKAEKYIFLEYFIMGKGVMWDGILKILKEKAQQGLDVRVLYDDFGCITTLPSGYDKYLRKLGIQAKVFNPFVPVLSGRLNNRDHRKLMIIDGKVGFTGGVNLADEYINKLERFGYWKDSAVRMEGPAARSFANIFLAFWKARYPEEPMDLPALLPEPAPQPTDCLVQPFADSPADRETVAKNVYLDLIAQAQRRLYICTPYLILDNDLLSALRLAAKRGVDVRIYTPGTPDKPTIYFLTRSYFANLLQAGVRIYSYTPGFLHAKTWLCDDRVAAVGTVNLDYRSLYLHFECSALLYGGRVLEDIRADLAGIERESKRLGLEDCRTGFLGTMCSAVLRLLAPLC